MADERHKVDANRRAAGVIGGYAHGDAIGATSPTIIAARVNSVTGRLLVDSSASLVPATSGGWSIARDIDLDEATPANIKASAGQVGGWYLYNNAATTVYVKLYNKASAPILASDTPKMTIPVPSGGAANVEISSGIEFDTGIGWACTTGVADNDTGSPAANDMVANLLYI